jgi:hypothetical protein
MIGYTERMIGVAAGLVLLATSSTWAGVPPQSDEELNALSDIVVDATVISVEFVALTEVPDELQRLHMEATLETTHDHLGGAPQFFVIPFPIDFIEPPIASCGFNEPAHWVGEQSKLWLHTLETEDQYGMVSWNAQEETAESAPQPLTDKELLRLAYGLDAPNPPVDNPPVDNPVEPTGSNDTENASAGCTLSAQGTPGSFLPIALFALLVVSLRRRQRVS